MRSLILFFVLAGCVLAQPNLYITTPQGVPIYDLGGRRFTGTLTVAGTGVVYGQSAVSVAANQFLQLTESSGLGRFRLDTSEILSTVTVGSSARAVAVSPDGRFAYFVYGTGSVGRKNLTDTSAPQVIYTGPATNTNDPSDLAVNRAGTRLYIAERSGTGNIRVLDISNTAAATAPQVASVALTGKPNSLAVAVDDKRVYAAGEGISILDTTTNTVLPRLHTGRTFNVIRVADFFRAFVTSNNPVLETFSLVDQTLTLFANTMASRALVISADTRYAYVGSTDTPLVKEVDLLMTTVRDIVGTAGNIPIALALGPPPRGATGCIATVQPGSLDVPSAGGTQSVGVEQQSDCTWTSTSGSPWIRITRGATGTGTGLVEFTVDPNTALAGRTGSLVVGGRRVIVNQAGRNCTYSISPGSRLTTAEESTGDIDISAPAGCAWTARSDVPWIRITETDTSGTGNGFVSYIIDANTSAARRTGTLTVARQTYTVTQLGVGPAIACIPFGLTRTIRPEGQTEPVGDIVVVCTGNSAATTVSGDVFLQFNTPVTNRRGTGANSDLIDAWLLVNDPGGPGGSAVAPGTNAFQGRLAGPNLLRFSGSFAFAAGSNILRVVNVRVAGGFKVGVVTARVGVRSTTPVAMNFDNTVPAFGFSSLRPTIGTLSSAGPNATIMPVSFPEQSEGNFRSRVSSAQQTSSVPGQDYGTESGFMNPVLGAATGLADTGTRLRLRVPVPTGVKVYAAVNPIGGTQARLYSADANGVGGTAVTGAPLFGGTYQELTATGGFATATWEVLTPDLTQVENYTFNIVLEGASEAQRTEIIRGAIGTYAPASPVLVPDATAPVPRFGDPLNPPKFVNLRVVTRAIRLGTLSILGSKTPIHTSVGSNFVFNYDVFNDSSENATGVVVRGSLPPQFNYTGCTVPGGTCSVSGSDVTATIGEVSGGGSASVAIQATQTADLPAGSVLESRVNVASNEADADLASNEATSGFVLDNCPANSLSSSTGSFTAAGGTGQFDILAGCNAWNVRASADWVVIDTAPSGGGPTTVRYTVSSNLGTAARTTTIIAAGLVVTITQAGSGPTCGLTVNSTGMTSAPAEGRTGVLAVTLTGAACAWTARSSQAWVELFPLSGNANGNVSFTVYPNFGTQQRTATVTIGDVVVTMTQAGMTGTADQRFVRRTYFNVLRRVPSAADEAFHVASLATRTRAQVMQSFLEGGEFRAGGGFVSGLYRVLLGRVPEIGGWAFQLNSVVSFGTAQSALAGAFLNTPEWQLKQGATVTNEQFVRLLFQEVLGRQPSPEELAFQLPGASNRGQLATNFLGIPEFWARNGPLLNALHAYFVILGRDPTPTELSGLEARLRSGTTFAALVTEFVNSAEHNAALQ